jgi:dipeptidyl-peptidase-4
MRKLNLFIAAAIVTIGANAQETNKKLTVEDIWGSGSLAAKGVYGIRSMNDGLHYSSSSNVKGNKVVLQYDYATGNVSDTIFSTAWVKGADADKVKAFSGYDFSGDEAKLLLTTDEEAIYRRSAKANYFVYDRKTKAVQLLSEGGKQQNAQFAPNGQKLAFMRDNNLFIKDLATGKEQQITNDGKINSIINGHADWVYEEEFAISQSFYWSPEGNKLAYYKFDESKVKEFEMAIYGNLYPEEYKYKYPKAGEANSTVGVRIYDLTTGKTIKVELGEENDQYIPRVKWTKSNNILAIERMNRLQNKLELLLVDELGNTKTILTETDAAYVDVNDDLTFLKDGKHFIFSSGRSGFNHLYLYNLNGTMEKQITSGNWEVTNFIGIDEAKSILYYQSVEPSTLEKYIYAIKKDGTRKKDLTPFKGTNNAVFSNSFKYFINVHSDANTPDNTTLYTSDGKLIRTLEDNATLKTKLAQYNLPKKEFFTFTTSEGVLLNGWMIKPIDFDASKKYPVLMVVYGGSGRNMVTDTWNGNDFLWHSLLTQKGYIVASVDNRGTELRGEAFKKSIYKQLGKLETTDQIEANKYLGKQSYIDANRIGMWGWSFGGYMTSLCMTKGADLFKTGIAVAPVTNWRYYDNIYTERYLTTPQENPKGYDENSPINFADKLKGKFLLVHGTADDNVHFQNSMEFVTKLITANKQFENFFYPNKNHGIRGGNTRLHLYIMMTDFLIKNL